MAAGGARGVPLQLCLVGQPLERADLGEWLNSDTDGEDAMLLRVLPVLDGAHCAHAELTAIGISAEGKHSCLPGLRPLAATDYRN